MITRKRNSTSKLFNMSCIIQKNSKFQQHNFIFIYYYYFLGPHPWHMEVPRLGVWSELQLPACVTAIAMPDSSHICDLHQSSWQSQILNPLSKARDRTSTSWFLVRFISTVPWRQFQGTFFLTVPFILNDTQNFLFLKNQLLPQEIKDCCSWRHPQGSLDVSPMSSSSKGGNWGHNNDDEWAVDLITSLEADSQSSPLTATLITKWTIARPPHCGSVGDWLHK